MLDHIVAPISIVGYGSADELAACLAAVGKQRNCPRFGVFICENGGSAAFDVLIEALTAQEGPCPGRAETTPPAGPQFVRTVRLTLSGASAPVYVSEAATNLGFAGGHNAWIRLFLAEQGWKGVWLLNPDTWPEPDALGELVSFAEKRGKGMMMSRIMFPDRTDVTASRGLKWDKWRARTIGLDYFKPVDPVPDPDEMERRMDSPSGVSFYVTRACIDTIGLMEDGYFLYCEEFDWGILAKAACGVGYAHTSVVPHISGSTTGHVRERAKRSPAAVYLTYRNRIHLVRRRFPAWLPWTVLVSFAWTGEYLVNWAPRNFVYAWKGIFAGLRGEWGKPSAVKLGEAKLTLREKTTAIAVGP